MPLAPLTTWKVGGPAELYAEPEEDEVPSLLKWANERDLPLHFLGRGSNVLIASEGLRGLVINTRNSLLRLENREGQIEAGAGVSLMKLSKFAASAGFRGYEFLIGIPGTVGGGAVMNAGLTVFHPREMKDIMTSVTLLKSDGEVVTRTIGELSPSYRYTNIQGTSDFVISARFENLLPETETSEITTVEYLKERKRKQPIDKPTAGSTYKSPPGGKAAGWYIERCGLKGHGIGGALVSPKHANWIENAGNATSHDILRILELIESTVAEKFGITLEREIKYLC